MAYTPKEFFLKYGIPIIAIVVIVVQLFFVNTQSLTKWKGGGYGMYTGIHYYYDQIYIPGLSVDSMIADNIEMKTVLGRLKLMPNDKNLKTAAKLVLETTEKDSVLIQVWKPEVNSKNANYTRVLINEIHLKKSEL